MYLILGTGNNNKFVSVELREYPQRPTELYIYPKEGWHLISRIGTLQFPGDSIQGIAVSDIFINEDFQRSLDIVMSNFSKAERMYEAAIKEMLAQNDGEPLVFKTVFNKGEAYDKA